MEDSAQRNPRRRSNTIGISFLLELNWRFVQKSCFTDCRCIRHAKLDASTLIGLSVKRNVIIGAYVNRKQKRLSNGVVTLSRDNRAIT